MCVCSWRHTVIVQQRFWRTSSSSSRWSWPSLCREGFQSMFVAFLGLFVARDLFSPKTSLSSKITFFLPDLQTYRPRWKTMTSRQALVIGDGDKTETRRCRPWDHCDMSKKILTGRIDRMDPELMDVGAAPLITCFRNAQFRTVVGDG